LAAARTTTCLEEALLLLRGVVLNPAHQYTHHDQH
jgi:hypothetical protein